MLSYKPSSFNVRSNFFLKYRQEAVKHRVRQVFYHWLERARRSLHRRRIMQDFPASVIPLSIKEHAQRWSISKIDDSEAWELCSKGNEKVLDIPGRMCCLRVTSQAGNAMIITMYLHWYISQGLSGKQIMTIEY